jgi:hypothetical protein
LSFYFGTQAELLYAYFGAATPLATFTTEDSLQKTYPAVVLPGGFFANAGARTSSLKIVATGIMNSTASPTFTVAVRTTTATPPAFSAGGTLLGTTAAMTGANAAVPWRFEMETGLRTLGVGAASTLATTGEFRSAGIVSPFISQFQNATPTTFEVDLQYFLWLSCACNASNGSNTMTLESLRVYGED